MLCEPYIVVPEAARMKSISSSTMNASVKMSGDWKNRERRSAEFLTEVLYFPALRL